MFLVAALGLVVAGSLFRIAMKIAGARRRRIIVDRPQSHWVDDEQQYAEADNQPEELIDELIDEFIDRPESDLMDDRNEHELRDGEQRSGLVHQGAKLIDGLKGSVLLTASDDTPRHLFRNGGELQEDAQRRDRKPDVADEISKREDTLKQLKRDLNRLLQAPTVA
jgi:hypothetical protein